MAELKAYRKKYTNKHVKPEREEYVLTLKNIGTISADDIIEEAADHCRLQKGDIRTAFDAITQAMVLFLKIGHGVQLPNIGSLQPSLRAKAVLTAEACTQETLKGTGGVNINMQPIGDFKKAVDGFKIRIVKSSTDDTAVEDGGGNGSAAASLRKVKVTFRLSDDNTEVREYAVGEEVNSSNVPEPEDGKMWPLLPFTMGDWEDFEFDQCMTSLYDTVYPDGKLSIKFMPAEGAYTERTTLSFAVGETVTAPDAPQGKHWPEGIIGTTARPAYSGVTITAEED